MCSAEFFAGAKIPLTLAFEYYKAEMKNNIWDKYWRTKSNHEWWEQPAPEVVEFIESLSPEFHPCVLDLGCGLGRHAIAFAKHGFRVTATDSSQQAINHLQNWAKQLDLSIITHECGILEQPFHAATFDIVLSYNVIYHGKKSQFTETIRGVWRLLKPFGFFFFTCPTRKDGKYGYGEHIAPHTYASSKSVIPGDIHYFADRTDLDEMLTAFAIRSIQVDEGHWNNKGEEQFFSNWHVLVEKVE